MMRRCCSKKKVMYSIGVVLMMLIVSELASRIYLASEMRAPFFKPAELLFTYYPELQEVKQLRIDPDDGYFDILFLDGSVLHEDWGTIEALLADALKNRTRAKVRIHNVSMPTHTSLDSYYKYRYLVDKRFDLVLLYHGINEVRANNCPPFIFKEDYAHYSWYEDLNMLQTHKEIDFTTLPYMFHYLAVKIRQRYAQTPYVPTHEPIFEWRQYGGEIKTGGSFRKNITGILEIAAAKKEPVLLMTYAFFVPDEYSLQAFLQRSLDYGNHACPVELWGDPDNVVKGIEVHNKIIRDLAQRYKKVLFIDQERLVPKSGIFFNDICHLSQAGCEQFVRALVEVIVAREQQRAGS